MNSIKLENKIYTEAELNEGIDVTLGGKEEKSITFTVTINPFKDWITPTFSLVIFLSLVFIDLLLNVFAFLLD